MGNYPAVHSIDQKFMKSRLEGENINVINMGSG